MFQAEYCRCKHPSADGIKTVNKLQAGTYFFRWLELSSGLSATQPNIQCPVLRNDRLNATWDRFGVSCTLREELRKSIPMTFEQARSNLFRECGRDSPQSVDKQDQCDMWANSIPSYASINATSYLQLLYGLVKS